MSLLEFSGSFDSHFPLRGSVRLRMTSLNLSVDTIYFASGTFVACHATTCHLPFRLRNVPVLRK